MRVSVTSAQLQHEDQTEGLELVREQKHSYVILAGKWTLLPHTLQKHIYFLQVHALVHVCIHDCVCMHISDSLCLRLTSVSFRIPRLTRGFGYYQTPYQGVLIPYSYTCTAI